MGYTKDQFYNRYFLVCSMLPLANVITRHGIAFPSYGNDNLLYVDMSPDDIGPLTPLLAVF